MKVYIVSRLSVTAKDSTIEAVCATLRGAKRFVQRQKAKRKMQVFGRFFSPLFSITEHNVRSISKDE